MDKVQLTRKQKEFFDYIVEYKKEHDVWPTYREISDEFNYKSPNSVTQNIQALLKKGYLIKGEDDEYDIHPDHEEILGIKSNGIEVRGVIAAGYLQEAVEADLGKITLDTLFPNLDQMFALRVAGMSMKDAGIYDGDFVLLMDSDVKDGDIGAILYDGETSLKRIFYDKNGLRLEPANDEYKTIHVEPDVFEEVRVIGKYIGHVNRNGYTKLFSVMNIPPYLYMNT
jgi:SOS regulatory protein LexA